MAVLVVEVLDAVEVGPVDFLTICDQDALPGVGSNVRLRGIPVVMITGDSDVSTESRLCGLGAESFLHKPFSLADLASSVQYGLEHRQRDTDTGPAAASLPFQARLLRSVGSHLPISYGVIF